ncbi:MAG TPA: class I SAM-dependent methyltransferase [Gaiellaceae bacterium]|nr:class I SAM-dependent methyltransferase [Gaiellaceae bacterium]
MSVDEERAAPFAAHAAQEQFLDGMERARNYNDWLLRRSRPYLGRRVLDAGAGSGTFSERLAADSSRSVVAVEPDPAFELTLRQRFADDQNVVVVAADATALQAEVIGGRVDSIICFNVLEHIRDHRAALQSFHDLLVEGGHLLLVVPAHPFLFGSLDEAVEHERRYRKEDVERELTAAGFRTRTLQLVNPVGAVGWLVSSRILKRRSIPARSLGLFDRLVPLLRPLDRVPLPVGLSVWAVAERPSDEGTG